MTPSWVIPLLYAVALTPVVLWVGYYIVIPRLTLEGFRRGVPATEFYAVDGSEGAGSIDIEYNVLYFDVRRSNVVLRGKVPDALHWQVGAFDGFTRLVDGAYTNNSTVSTDGQGNYQITLTSTPASSGDNIFDCSSGPRGLVVFRIVLPRSKVDLPRVQIEPRS